MPEGVGWGYEYTRESRAMEAFWPFPYLGLWMWSWGFRRRYLGPWETLKAPQGVEAAGGWKELGFWIILGLSHLPGPTLEKTKQNKKPNFCLIKLLLIWIFCSLLLNQTCLIIPVYMTRSYIFKQWLKCIGMAADNLRTHCHGFTGCMWGIGEHCWTVFQNSAVSEREVC